MSLHLRVSTTVAHLEDLRTRLSIQMAHGLSCRPERECVPDIGTLLEVVRAMDRGAITRKQAAKAFACISVPDFDFDSWLVQMLDEEVYLESSSKDEK